MSKIICDVCGTSYPDTAECCPICGCTPDMAGKLMSEDLLEETSESQETPKKIFDFDEVNGEQTEDEDTYDDGDYDDEEEDEEEPQSQNTLVVIVLTVLIAVLLMAAGFIFVKFFLPNMGGKSAVAATETTETTVSQTTDLSIPCQELYIISGKTVELSEEGQMFLLHVKASPENTTDPIIYTSQDEAIATVTEDGKVTAVSEGETVITIRCGVSTMECPVIVKYVEETTVPPTTVAETAPAETVAAQAQAADTQETTPKETTAQQETTPATSAPANQQLKNVTLKLKKTDIRLGVYYEFKLLLDCDLEQNEVQWSSEHPYIASVDENGVVKAIKAGTTAITAQYGDQKVQCIVRCS